MAQTHFTSDTPPVKTAKLTVAEKSQRLFRLGYRLELVAGDVLLITSPIAGRVYRIDPRAGNCSCPSIVRCSHLLGWFQLAIDCADALCWEGCEYDTIADLCKIPSNGGCYSETGLEMRAKAVDCCDRAQALRFWSEDVLAANAAETRRAA